MDETDGNGRRPQAGKVVRVGASQIVLFPDPEFDAASKEPTRHQTAFVGAGVYDPRKFPATERQKKQWQRALRATSRPE